MFMRHIKFTNPVSPGPRGILTEEELPAREFDISDNFISWNHEYHHISGKVINYRVQVPWSNIAYMFCYESTD